MSNLPKGWAWTTLNDVADINPRLSTRPADDTPASFVGMADLDAESATTGPGHTRPFSEVSRGYTLFQKSDILVAKITPCFQNSKIGLADITHQQGAGSTEFHVIRPQSQYLDERYLLHFLRRKEILLAGESQMTGSGGQRRVPVQFLQKLRIPLPPLEEQRRIATILDRAATFASSLDLGLEKLDALSSTSFEQHYQGLDSFENLRLEDVATIGSGITKGRKIPNAPLFETPYLTVANVQDGYLNLKQLKTISVTEQEHAKYALRNGDIVLTEGGDPDKLGRGTIWRNEVPGAIHQNHVFRVTPDKSRVEPLYLALALRSYTSKQYFLRAAKQTTGIATINKSQLRRTPLRVPSLKTQQRALAIAQQLSITKVVWIHRQRDHQSLTQSLQSRAFRGEL